MTGAAREGQGASSLYNSVVGNGTIGLEILEDLPNVSTVIAPFGGGGLTCGIASAMQAKQRKDVKVYACEVFNLVVRFSKVHSPRISSCHFIKSHEILQYRALIY